MASKKPLENRRPNHTSNSLENPTSLSQHVPQGHDENKEVCQECGKSFTPAYRLREHKERIHGNFRTNQPIELDVPRDFMNDSMGRTGSLNVTATQPTSLEPRVLPPLRPLIEAYRHNDSLLDRVHEIYQQPGRFNNDEVPRGTAMGHHSISYNYTHSSGAFHPEGSASTTYQPEGTNDRATNLMDFGEEEIYDA